MNDRDIAAFRAWWIDYRGFDDPHDGAALDAWQAALAHARQQSGDCPACGGRTQLAQWCQACDSYFRGDAAPAQQEPPNDGLTEVKASARRLADKELGYYKEMMGQQEPPQQSAEPVAWMVYTQDGKSVFVTDNPTDIPPNCRALPLFTESKA